jgi:hypothetical protein
MKMFETSCRSLPFCFLNYRLVVITTIFVAHLNFVRGFLNERSKNSFTIYLAEAQYKRQKFKAQNRCNK